MRTRDQAAVGLLVFLLACPTSAVHAAKYKIHWLIGHQNLDYFEEAAMDFKKAVETGSHGDIEVHITTAASDEVPLAWSASEIADKVAKGEAEMGHSFTDVIGNLDHRLWAFGAPYLFRDYRHMEGVFEGPLGAGLLGGLRTPHIVGLAFTYSGGANGVATRDREIRRPEDLKGLRVGVYGDPVSEAWLSSLGATPVAVKHNYERILPLAREGSLDAVVITWRNFKRAVLNQGFKHFNLTESTYLVSVTYINEEFFKSLPEAYRALIKETAHQTGRIERAKTIELNESAKREMTAKGVRPVHLTEDSRGAFVQALRPAYERSIERLIGKDLIEGIRKTGDGPDHPWMPSDLAARWRVD